MEIVRLPEGVAADIAVDCIAIERKGDRFVLSGTLLDGDTSISMGPIEHDSFAAAEEAGAAWAAGHGVRTLRVATVAYEADVTETATD